MAIVMRDLRDAILHLTTQGLAFAEHLTPHRIERIVIHADEGTAQQIDSIEHDAPRDARLAAAKVAFGLADARRAGIPAQQERMPAALGDTLQDRQVEIDDVPARQDIGIEPLDALAEGIQRGKFIGAARGTLGHGPLAAIDDQHLVDVWRV